MRAMSDLLTTAQVASILGVSRRQVNRMVASGKLTPAQKLEGQTGAHLFRPDALPVPAGDAS